MSLPRWTSSSSANRADELVRQGYAVSSRTVLRTLHKLGYSLQAKAKVTERAQHPDRVTTWPTTMAGSPWAMSPTPPSSPLRRSASGGPRWAGTGPPTQRVY